MGPAIGTQIITAAFERLGATVVHVNTQDRRTVFNTGVFDARNLALALRHTGLMTLQIARHPVRLVYVPISQGRWGYVRDAVFMAIARLFRRPIVVHMRGSNLQRFFHSSSRVERALIRRTLKWAIRAIALTPGLGGVYNGLVASDRVRILENAIHDPWPHGVEAARAERLRRLASAPTDLHILYLANDFATKGATTLVRALAEPGLERAAARMAGAPPPDVAEETAQLAHDLGVAERLELVGGVASEHKWQLYEWADVFAYPTENDGQPLVLLEAMAAGLPIVTSTYGGVPDTVGDCALIVEPGRPATLAAALRRLIDEPNLRPTLGADARARYVAQYTPEAFQERFAAVFGDLIDLRIQDSAG